jgi:hypothetical protein
MARLNAANKAESVLAQAVSVDDLIIVVANASLFPNAPFKLSIEDEILEVTEVVGNSFTVLRGQENTSIGTYVVGTLVENKFTAGSHNELVSKEEFDEHQADDTAHGLGSAPLETEAQTIREAINEVFQSGNSRKEDLVDQLLSLDPSLPITYESTWEEILIATGQISTGVKVASGSVTSTAATTNFPTYNSQIQLPYVDILKDNLGFIPSVITYYKTNKAFPIMVGQWKLENFYDTGTQYANCHHKNEYIRSDVNNFVDKIRLPADANVNITWIAYGQ